MYTIYENISPDAETFTLFIPFAGMFHAVWVSSFHPMWNVRCVIGFMNAPKITSQRCELMRDRNAIFCNTLHLGLRDSPGKYHLRGWYGLWSWSILRETDRAFLWSHSSETEVLVHKAQTQSSLRSSPSHPAAQSQTSSAPFHLIASNTPTRTQL